MFINFARIFLASFQKIRRGNLDILNVKAKTKRGRAIKEENAARDRNMKILYQTFFFPRNYSGSKLSPQYSICAQRSGWWVFETL